MKNNGITITILLFGMILFLALPAYADIIAPSREETLAFALAINFAVNLIVLGIAVKILLKWALGAKKIGRAHV